MTEQPQSPAFHSLVLTQNPNSPEITQRLANLFGRHAALTKSLRELCHQTTAQTGKEIKWNDLENEVVNLRIEIEAFKQVFTSPTLADSEIINADLLEF